MATIQYPISIRFVGKKLDTHSIPIYELGEVLLALQRIINRAYLLSITRTGENDETVRLQRRSIHSKATREKLSLQLAGREAGSDVYNLTWFTEDIGAQVVKAMISHVSSAAAAYAKKTVFTGTLTNPKRVNPNASALFGEIKALTNRIKSVGDIEKIEISMQGRNVPIIIDKNTKAYVKRLEGLQYLGKKDVIGGSVVTAHVHSKDTVDVYDPARNRRIRVRVNKRTFKRIISALNKDDNPYFEFHGKPRLRIGKLETDFREFVASSLTVTLSSGALPGKRTTKAPPPKRKQSLHGKPTTKGPGPKN